MGEIKKLTTPLTEEAIQDLHAGDSVMLSGVIYTARDKAHKLLTETLAAGKELPVDLRNQLIYYVGPAPAKPGQPIGSCGPTTSSRMDSYAPMLIRQAGLKGMLGKGPRSQDVIDAMKEQTAVYFGCHWRYRRSHFSCGEKGGSDCLCGIGHLCYPPLRGGKSALYCGH